MLIIRYQRVGKRNYAQFKIVVAEKSSPVKGKSVEILGSYDPHSKEVVLKKDRINYWLLIGAQCSDSVHNLLVSKGLIKEKKRKINIKQKPAEEKEGEIKKDDRDKKKEKKEEESQKHSISDEENLDKKKKPKEENVEEDQEKKVESK